MTLITIAAPAYNEEKNINKCISDWTKALEAEDVKNYEIVICNDCSTDSTKVVVENAQATNNKIQLVNHEVNKGAAAAVITAGNKAIGENIIFIDSDGQFPTESLREIIRGVKANPNTNIFGYRDIKKDNLPQKLGTKLTSFLYNICNPKRRLKDASCILKSFTSKNYQNLKLKSSGLNVSTEMSSRSAELKQKYVEVLIKHRPRVHGESSAAGVKVIKHGIKRVSILIYFIFRKAGIILGLLNP
jgi:glycosyltransferase involved in cell wall biosynthesis